MQIEYGQLRNCGRMQITIITRQYLHAVHTSRFNNNFTVKTILSHYAVIIYRLYIVNKQIRIRYFPNKYDTNKLNRISKQPWLHNTTLYCQLLYEIKSLSNQILYAKYVIYKNIHHKI